MGDMLTMNSLGDGSTLSLDFTTGVLDSRLTFTRSTTATYINSSGYVTSAAINAPRFDYSPTNIGEPRGLLIEGQATNMCNWSSAPQSWVAASSGTTITDGSGLAPDNLSTPKQLAMTDSAYHYQLTSATHTAGVYVFSMWLKASSTQLLGIRICRNADGAIKGMITATVTTSWQRFNVSFTSNATDAIDFGFDQRNFGAGSSVVGPAVAATFLMWGAQVEAGAVSSHIPTGASQVTRAVDTAIIAAGTNFSSWYTGGTTGTFVTEWCRCNPTTTQRTVIATSDVSNQHLHQYIAATTSRLRLADKVPAFIETANASIDNSINKGAFSYSGSVQSLCLNGGTVVPGTLTFTTAPTWLSIGGPSTNGTSITDTAVVLNNAIRKIKYFPARLSDAQIKEITT